VPYRDYVALARQYEAGVASGSVQACRWVRLACERNTRDIRAASRTGALFRFDVEAAVRVCAFVEMMPHVLGDFAKPTIDDAGGLIWPTIELQPWQCWLLTTVFGWLRVRDGRRRFRIALLLIPRKNGKSFLLAAIANYMLTSDGEAGAKCYSAATTRDQAKIVAETAYQMASRLPSYREYFGVKLGAKTQWMLSVPATASTMEPLSADANTLDGLNIHFAAVDELHAHKTRHVWDVLETATGARSQPLIFPISTAGTDTSGICYELLTYLHKLLEQSVSDDTFFGVEFTTDPADDPFDEDTLRKANPNYGVSVQPDDLARKAVKAKNSPAALNNYLTKHLNIWVRGEVTWAPIDAWIKAGDPSMKMEQCKAWPCWIGVDLAEVRDIAAVVVVFKRPDGTLVVLGRYYLPEQTIAKSPNAQYSGWVHQGSLIATDGDQADYERIENDITDLCKTYKVQRVCFDRALASQMGQSLTKKLGAKPEVITVNQTVDVMNPAMQTVERMILSGQMTHDADPLMTWMLGNVVVQRNYKDEVFPRKAGGKDSANKIDGPVALFTVIGQVMVTETSTKPQLFFFGGQS
jgi:phage terminase large subunit-like protein